MICAVDAFDYLKPFLLGIFLGAFAVYKLTRRPDIHEIEMIAKRRYK